MKRHTILIVPALITILFTSLDCMAASALFPPTSTPTSTATRTPTVTPSPTPTLTPTITPTPMPDYSSMGIRLVDLPSGFSAGFAPTDPNDPSTRYYEYENPSPFQVIVGAVGPVTPRNQFAFDALMKNPDLLLQSINAKSNLSQMKSFKQVSDLDDFGDVSDGFTGRMTTQGVTLQTDMFIMRKGVVGVFVVSMYSPGRKPAVSILDLANILDKRTGSSPTDTFSG